MRVGAGGNPVTAVATAVREGFGNEAPTGVATAGGWPADNALLYAFRCCIASIAIFAPIAVAQYRGISRR